MNKSYIKQGRNSTSNVPPLSSHGTLLPLLATLLAQVNVGSDGDLGFRGSVLGFKA